MTTNLVDLTSSIPIDKGNATLNSISPPHIHVKNSKSLELKESKKSSKKQHRLIEIYLKKEKQKYDLYKNEPSLLILGSSDSGKSTLLKQLKLIHGNGFTSADKESSKLKIWIGMLNTMKAVISHVYQQQRPEKFQLLFNDVEDISEEDMSMAGKLLHEAWNDEKIVISLETLPEAIKPHDCTEHFMKNITDIFRVDYEPTDEDMLLFREVTRSISESVFTILNTNYHFIDVSGLKIHRKQWVPYFTEVSCILFIISLACYNQTMAEDEKTNRMTDSIQLFKEIACNPLLQSCGLILFLNKQDLFKKKIGKYKIGDYLSGYYGNSEKEAYRFFEQKFKISANRHYTYHYTTAVNTKNMKTLLNDICSQLLKKDLDKVGLV